MKKCVLTLLTFLCSVVCFSQVPPQTYYLTHVTVIDLVHGGKLPDRTVIIADSIIVAVEPANQTQIPEDALEIDCTGKYILPGLWDMHVHLGNATGTALPLFVANGITGVRDMGSKDFEAIQTWRKRIKTGVLVGPRIVASGPILNGGRDLPDFQISVNTIDDARRNVDSLVDLGVDFVKVHGGLSRENYYAIADQCARRGVYFAGHIPISNSEIGVTGQEASEAGQRSLEHMLGIPFARDTIRAFQHMYPTEESLQHLFLVLVKNNTYVTPTLSVYQIPADYLTIAAAQDSLLKYVSPELKAFWKTQTGDWPNRDKTFMNWLLMARRNMIPLLRDAGVPMLAGTDTGFPFVLPGFGLHEELKYMVAAGLTPTEALRTATINPAIFFEIQNKLGSVESGKFADLLILNADPTQDIGHTRSISAVIVNGKIYSHAALGDILKQTAGEAESPL